MKQWYQARGRTRRAFLKRSLGIALAAGLACADIGLAWAEVGEPEGVRTIVFDLVVRPDPQNGERRPDGSDDGAFQVFRLDADPYEDAVDVARAIERALGERAAASLKNLAADGVASWSYPDLESFEEAVIETLALG